MSKKKLKFKKFYFHPITTFIILIFTIILLSGILSLFGMYGSYSKINEATGTLESTIVSVKNLCNYDGIKFIISNAVKNFMSFSTLSTLLITLIGLGVAKSTGLLDTVIKRYITKIDNKKITFLLIFIATISSLINEIGYVILIPLSAIIYMANNRNPLAGITAAYCGVAFGYGATIFVGSMEVNLNKTTELSARLIDPSAHISLTCNLFVIIITSIILSIVGTIIIEKIMLPRLGKFKPKMDLSKTLEFEIIDEELEEQQRLETDANEKKGLRYAFITAIIVILIMIYSLIPNLPLSGFLLDMEEKTYLGQLFGPNSYFQDGFNYMVSLFFIFTGIAYGIGSKKIENDKDLIYGANEYLMQMGSLIGLLFFASQFVAIFKESNIGTIITIWGCNILSNLNFSGIALLLIVIIVIAISNLFITTPLAKWTILAPVVVPKLMQSNISPQFAQFILRAGDSMTKGITPVLAFFVIFIGYLNIYNADKNKPITIGNALKLIMPYCLIISLTWLAIILTWYVIGLPLGPRVFPTI